MRYYVDYNTGAGNDWVEGTLSEAKKVAEDGLAYTQTDVKIRTEGGKDAAVLPWWGVTPEDGDIVTARFGNFGFYGEWQDL